MNRYCRKIEHITYGTNQHLPQPAGKQDGTDALQHASTLQPQERRGEVEVMPSYLRCS